jgi:hypothetical protein
MNLPRAEAEAATTNKPARRFNEFLWATLNS